MGSEKTTLIAHVQVAARAWFPGVVIEEWKGVKFQDFADSTSI